MTMRHTERAILYDPATGATGEYEYEGEYSDGFDEGSLLYIWTEGNYSCDCNRSLFLYGLENTDPPDRAKLHCGETIQLISLSWDGRELDLE